MHVGMGVTFENLGHERSDFETYRDELALADLAEPLGFESIWATEHHFTDYQVTPDPLQFITYMAGRTRRAELGTMAVILPWHEPLRLTERISLLDTLSNGRVLLGIGRGTGRIEFEGFRIPMDESRERLIESAQIVLRGLEEGHVEYQGKYFQIPRREIRPTPIKSFKGRSYAAAISPESLHIMAELGVGLLIVPQKPWETVVQDLAIYRKTFKEVNGDEAPAPVVSAYVICDPDGERAREKAYHYLGNYYKSSLVHYEMVKDHLKDIKGYEFYSKMTDSLKRHGVEDSTKFFVNLHVWGTPEQCYEKIVAMHEKTGCERFVGIFRSANLPLAEAEQSMRLFASEVKPRLQALGANVAANPARVS